MPKLAPYSAAMLSFGALANPAESLAQPIFVVDSQSSSSSNFGSQTFWALTHNTGAAGTAGVVLLFCWGGIEPTSSFSNSNGTLSGNSSLPWIQENLSATTTITSSGPNFRNQGIVIGIKGGECAPSWLASLPTHPVPMPAFQVKPWDDSLGPPAQSCSQTLLPASWDSNYGSQYLSVVNSVMSVVETLTLSDGESMISHVVAIADGAMIQTGSDEMGVYSDGCSITNTSGSVADTLAMSRYQVAQTWASLPWPDNYTPATAQAAYRTIFDGLLNIAAGLPHNKWGKQIAITENLDGSDSHDWPAIDSNGVPLPPQDDPVAAVPMYAPILAQAANDAVDCFQNKGTVTALSNCLTTAQLGTATAASEAVFGWPGLFNDSTSNPGYSGTAVKGVVLIVNAGAQSGAGVKWQFNNDSNTATINSNYFSDWIGSGLNNLGIINATSCVGRENTPAGSEPALAGTLCFATMTTLATQSSGSTISTATTLSIGGIGINSPSVYSPNPLLLQWLEVKPIDGLPMIDSSVPTPIGPLYGCFFDGTGSPYNPIGPEC